MLSVDQAIMWKLILGYNNVEQSVEDSTGPVHDLSQKLWSTLSSVDQAFMWKLILGYNITLSSQWKIALDQSMTFPKVVPEQYQLKMGVDKDEVQLQTETYFLRKKKKKKKQCSQMSSAAGSFFLYLLLFFFIRENKTISWCESSAMQAHISECRLLQL